MAAMEDGLVDPKEGILFVPGFPKSPNFWF